MQNEDGNISPLKAFFRNKWVRIILIIDALVLLAVIGVLIWQATKVSTINFYIAPVDATISVNGTTNYHNGAYPITPGTYEVAISREGLETKTFNVDIAPHNVATITTFLAGADNNFEFYELKDNYESFQQLAIIASKGDNITTDQDTSAEEFIAKYEQALSIFDKLPIKGYVYADPTINTSTAGFAIRQGWNQEGCEKTACLLVNYSGKDYEEAVKQEIEEIGYNPADYQIVYEKYKIERYKK